MAAVLAAVMLACATSCSSGFGIGVVIGDGYYDDDYYSARYFNGYQRGEYIYYYGRWYKYGIGTPYSWDPFYRDAYYF